MSKAPNILMLMSDEHAASAMGCDSDTLVRTPHLDSLARKGTYFANAYCQVPLCTPSRMCLLTSKHAHKCSAWRNESVLFPEHLAMPAHFARFGYTTCLVGKMHFGGKDQYHGFQHRPYGDLRGHAGHLPDPLPGSIRHKVSGPGRFRSRTLLAGITEVPISMQQESIVNLEAIEFLRENEDKSPWFLVASYARPHFPLTAPPRFFRHYWPDNVEMPRAEITSLDENHPFPKTHRALFETSHTTQLETKRARAAYFASCTFLDQIIGDLLTLLERDGFLDNTMVLYTSDHGEMLGEHGQWWKASYYEGASRVPLVMFDPSLPESLGRRVEVPVELSDVFPTLCKRANIPPPEHVDGQDLSPLMGGSDRDGRGTAVTELFWPQATGHMRMIRKGCLKYVVFPEFPAMLFDLASDPHETRDLSGLDEYRQDQEELHDRLMTGFSWLEVRRQIEIDSRRTEEHAARWGRGTPNQYQLRDGRVIDAEKGLYPPSVVSTR